MGLRSEWTIGADCLKYRQIMGTPRKKSGQFDKGAPGRPVGAKNKFTEAVKDVLRAALEEAGNRIEKGGGSKAYLLKMAEEEPKIFMAAVSKLIPNEVVGNLTIEHTLEVVDLSDKGKK